MFHLNRGIRRGLAFGLSLAMAVTMLPVNGAKASEKKTASDPARQEETGISDGTYLVPISGLKKALVKSTGTVWGNDTSTGIGMQLDRYATVEVKDDTYKTSLTLYGGSEMESLQIADEAASSDPETFNQTVLRSDLLEKDGVSEDGITALESAGVATDGAINAANVAATVKTTKTQGKAQFTFTDSAKRSQVGILAMSCLYSNNKKQYKKACFTSAAATLNWADAVKVNEESGKWSVQTTSVGAYVNSIGWDEEQSAFVQKFNAIFDKADVVKKDGKLQATIHIQKYGKEEYQIASIDKYDDEQALTSSNFTMLASNRLANTPLAITDSSFTVDFENPYDITYLNVNQLVDGSKKSYSVRLQLVPDQIPTYEKSSNGFTLSSKGASLADMDFAVEDKTDTDLAGKVVDADNVKGLMKLANKQGYHYYSMKLTDQDGEDAFLKSGVLSFDVPEGSDADQIAVCTVSTYSQEFDNGNVNTDYAAAQVEGVYSDGKKVYVPVSKFSGGDYIIFEKVQTESINSLQDGIYDVTATLWNATSNAQSMAGTVVSPKAHLLVRDGKKYLQITFNKASILYMPAFLSKAYAVNETSDDSIAKYTSGKIVEFWSKDEVTEYSVEAFMKNRGISREEAEQNVEENMFLNNLQYVKTVTLDITNSIITSGMHKNKVGIAFCCDIMDTLYGGIAGSDAGFNEAALMISEIENDKNLTEEDILGKYSDVDKSELKPLYEKAFEVSRKRTSYNEDTYNKFVPAWSLTYAAYNSERATKEQVDEAVAAMKTALAQLVDTSTLKKAISTAGNIQKRYAETESFQALSDELTKAKALQSDAEATQEQLDAESEVLLEKANAVLANQIYIDTVLKAIAKAEAKEKGDYTEASYQNYMDAVDRAKAVATGSAVNYLELRARNSDLSTASRALEKKVDNDAAEALQALIDEAEAKDLTIYRNYSVEELETALAEAKDALKSSGATQISKATTKLQEALDGLGVLEDGTYTVPVTLWKANADTVSMGNASLIQKAKLVVKNGKAQLYFGFKKMQFSGREGYLMSISTLSDIQYNENNYPVSYDKKPATVLSEYDVVDEYNKEDSTDPVCAGKKYPKQMTIPADLEQTLTWCEVYVPVMGSMNLGTQVCRLYVDYSKAQSYAIPDKSELAAQVEAAAEVDETLYTDASVKTFNAALDTAKEVLNNDYFQQSDADAAAEALKNAIDALEVKPSPSPSEEPTEAPTEEPTAAPSEEPTAAPSSEPTTKPSTAPSSEPSQTPSSVPTEVPSAAPTNVPSQAPSAVPSQTPAGSTEPAQTVEIKLNHEKAVLYTAVKNKLTLKASVTGTSEKVTWSSDNKKVATVNAKGVVTAKKAGKAVITAKAGNAVVTCSITVKKPVIKVTKSKITVKLGKKTTLEAKAVPGGKLKYVSSDKKIAKVSTGGTVTAKKVGKAVITVKGNGAKAKITIIVKK